MHAYNYKGVKIIWVNSCLIVLSFVILPLPDFLVVMFYMSSSSGEYSVIITNKNNGYNYENETQSYDTSEFPSPREQFLDHIETQFSC